MPSVTFSPLAILNGTASVGYRRFTTGPPAQVPDYRGFVSNVTLSTTVSASGSTSTRTFARDLQ